MKVHQNHFYSACLIKKIAKSKPCAITRVCKRQTQCNQKSINDSVAIRSHVWTFREYWAEFPAMFTQNTEEIRKETKISLVCTGTIFFPRIGNTSGNLTNVVHADSRVFEFWNSTFRVSINVIGAKKQQHRSS